MEAGSEEEGNRINTSPSEGTKKPKRQMKTPFQLETLEMTYASEMYPSEATRAELSEKLGLSDRQLQMWFCHRRLKDKKEGGVKKPTTSNPVASTQALVPSRADLLVTQAISDHDSRSRSRSESGSDQLDYGVERSFREPSPQRIIRRVIDCVEAQLGEPLRKDGPVLGMEFDELPPGAFGAPIVAREHWVQSRSSCDDKLFEQSDAIPSKATNGFMGEIACTKSDTYGRIPHFYDFQTEGRSDDRSLLVHGNGHVSRAYGVNLLSQQQEPVELSFPAKDSEPFQLNDANFHFVKKRKSNEDFTGRAAQANEKRIRKELEKQDILRRKREEQMRKEMEKQDRERQKEEERMMRERQRQEERFQREERREIERREKFLQKESLKAERKRQKEELRREKEAAKMKTALEKATARKIAKESQELIEDERLEMMELAASSKGLPSVISLDHDALQNLDPFRDSLCEFPPKSLREQLKMPFAVQPWIYSEENIGNLLMVWRFCTMFADVVGLWPFTLDEFVQALHDYDSRLLGEVHIALLKVIVKDIEDVARSPSGGPGTNQYTAVNPEGGHPLIVEGAFMWGFDIRAWLNHLNPLTWPEILRQFSLSGGFGPQLKRESVDRPCLPEDDEAKDCEAAVSMLRNGAAAEKAARVMQQKGHQRKSRHRLTPGTVKFAAYHVLCLEGEKGLTVLELADKIQRSGLRDLTTSKTPDASISVAMSRDPILFERIAPSTFCVRPAFRKDPAIAEEILSAARERIQRYTNGFLLVDNADEVDKDGDSGCDIAEGPEIDELGSPPSADKTINDYNEDDDVFLGNEKDDLRDDVEFDAQNEVDTDDNVVPNPDKGITEVDESKAGEPWVQGLTEGEYSDLSVEERLKVLVALIGIVNEGNTIRAILEDRLDAATALRKQMLAEAQLDKKRTKEEYAARFRGTAATEGNQSPFCDDNNNDTSLTVTLKDEPTVGAKSVHNYLTDLPSERSLSTQTTPTIQPSLYSAERSRLQLKAYIGHRAEEVYAYRSLPLGQDRRRNRYWQFIASTSKHDPGSGRIFVELHNGCWRLIDSEQAFNALLTSLDTRGVRESHLHTMLQRIEKSFKEAVRRRFYHSDSEAAQMGSLKFAATESPGSIACVSNSDTIEPSSSFRIELGRTETERSHALNRYQDLETWMWKECFNSSALLAMTFGKQRGSLLLGICELCLDTYYSKDAACPCCQRIFSTFGDKLNYLESMPRYEDELEVKSHDNHSSYFSSNPRIRLIKVMLTLLEALIPSYAYQSSCWENQRTLWGSRLHAASSPGDLLQILTQLESMIKRDCLSLKFETTEELLGTCFSSENVGCASDYSVSVPELPWIPKTTAAVALRLLELDDSIFSILRQQSESRIVSEVNDVTKRPSSDWHTNNAGINENVEMDQTEQSKDNDVSGFKNTRKVGSRLKQAGRNGRGCSGGGGARARWQKRVDPSLSASGGQMSCDEQTLSQLISQHRHARGRRTVRRRREKAIEDLVMSTVGKMPKKAKEQWVPEEDRKFECEDNDSSSEREAVVSDESEVEKWGTGYDTGSMKIWDSSSGDLHFSEGEDGLEDYGNNVGDNANPNDDDEGQDEDSTSFISGDFSG